MAETFPRAIASRRSLRLADGVDCRVRTATLERPAVRHGRLLGPGDEVHQVELRGIAPPGRQGTVEDADFHGQVEIARLRPRLRRRHVEGPELHGPHEVLMVKLERETTPMHAVRFPEMSADDRD